MSSATGNPTASGDVFASDSPAAASKLSWSAPRSAPVSAPASARGPATTAACGALMESVAEGTEPDGSEATASPPPPVDSAQEQWLDLLHQGTPYTTNSSAHGVRCSGSIYEQFLLLVRYSCLKRTDCVHIAYSTVCPRRFNICQRLVSIFNQC